MTVIGRSRTQLEHKARRLILRRVDLRGIDLARGDLGFIDFSGADFRRALLDKVAFNDATLIGANFSGSTLLDCDMSRAHLTGGLFRGRHTYLFGVDFQNADCTGVDFSNASVTRLDFAQAKFGPTLTTHGELQTNFSEVDLRETTGLSKEQVAQTVVDEATELPDRLALESAERGPDVEGNALHLDA